MRSGIVWGERESEVGADFTFLCVAIFGAPSLDILQIGISSQTFNLLEEQLLLGLERLGTSRSECSACSSCQWKVFP
jgi:hypothetical protein